MAYIISKLKEEFLNNFEESPAATLVMYFLGVTLALCMIALLVVAFSILIQGFTGGGGVA